MVDVIEWACVLCGHRIQNERVEKWICIKFCIKLQHFLHWNCLDDSEGCSYEQLVIGSFITTMHPCMHHVSCTLSHAKHQITQVTQPHYSPDLAPCDFWFFPKLKSPLKGKRFQTIHEIQENMTGQLMATGRTMWGPREPTWRGLRHLCPVYSVSCILYLLQ